ncbi:MAG: zinc dependent phospholipase C family protein [Bacilli bacterium]|nr:zinc dependent phospholipase C family protein [Bacilli bacterium]
MPSIYTHYNFSKDVYKTLDKNIQKKLDKSIDYYYMFSQSFDYFMYYNFLSLKPGKKIRDFQDITHDNYINDYFINIINYIKDNNLQNNSEVLSYLYGSLNHYTLDSTCHPFINYYSKSKNKSFKYKSYHVKNEAMIDAYFYNLNTNKDYADYKLYKDIIPKLKFSKELKETMDNVYEKTFNYKNIGKTYEKSYNQSYNIYKYLVYDKSGIKKVAYKIVDYLTFFKPGKIQYFSFHIKDIDKSILNLNHDKWYYPNNKEISSTESFIDLYNKSIKKASKLIEIANSILNNKTEIKQLTDLIADLSYATGLDWHNKNKIEIYKY